MSFIDKNIIQRWITTPTGIARNTTLGLYYVDNIINAEYTYSQSKNYQIITGVSSSNATVGSALSIKLSAPFKDSIVSETRDVSIYPSGVEFYTYANPLSTLNSKSIVRYGATESFTQSVITRSTLNEIDFLINGYREYNDLTYAIDDLSQPANGWYFNPIGSLSGGSYNWYYNSSNIIAPTYSVFGSGLDTIITQNFIAKPLEYDTFTLELSYNSTIPNFSNGKMDLYLVKADLLKTPNNWGIPIVSFTNSTIFATNNLPGINTDGSRNYLVISSTQSGNYEANVSNISIVGSYHPENNRLQLTNNGGTYSGTTPIIVNINSATYSHSLLQRGSPYSLSSKIGNGLFKVGIWENGVWNNGWRDDKEARDFDEVAFSVLTESDISWKIEIRGSTYSIQNLKKEMAISIGNIVAIDINNNRKILKDYYIIEDLNIGYNYSQNGVTESSYGWIRVNLNTTFPYRRIEKDSQNHKIKVTPNIWLSGGFFNGYFSGVWNNGLFKGLPRLTEMFDTHWIDGFFNGGRFNSTYLDSYKFTDLSPKGNCGNGYMNLTFDTNTLLLPGDYIIITLFTVQVLAGIAYPIIDDSYGGIAKIIGVDKQSTGDIITIDKIFTGNNPISLLGIKYLGSVVRYTATGLIQNFKFYDNNRSKIKSIDNSVSSAVFSFNSWVDVNYDETRAVSLGRDFRMFEPITKKSINRNNLYGYPTYDVLSSISRFRDSNTLDFKLYKLGTKYKLYTDFIGSGSGFNEPFNELDFSNFTNAGWTSSSNTLSDFTLKRTENIISLNNQTSLDFLNSGVTGNELYITASNTGLVLNNNNVNIDKSRYSIVEFDVITHSVTDYNFSYKNPDIYLGKNVDSSTQSFSETISVGPGSTLNNTITSTYNLSGPSGISVEDIVVMVDLYGDVIGTTINLQAPNGKIINLKKNGSGLGGKLSNTKFSLRNIYTKFSSVTTPYSLNNTTVSYSDTYLMDKEIGQGDSPYLSNSTTLSELTSTNNSIYGTWTLYIKYNPVGPVSCDLTNWSISIQYNDLLSKDTEPISSFPILNFSNLNYDITTQLSGYENVQVYRKMNYLPIRENINHLKVSNSFRLDSIEETTPAKWGGYGKNQSTKKYEYFYNKTDMMLSINGNGATGASASMVTLDNLNMYEVDMIPFFKYYDYYEQDSNIYFGIQIPFIGEAPDIDYLNSDFIFIDNITIGLDSLDGNSFGDITTAPCVVTNLIIATSSVTVTTSPVNTVTQTTVNVGGSITFTGSQYQFNIGGVYISQTSPPVNSSFTIVGNIGTFNGTVSGLSPNLTYYAMAFVTYKDLVTGVSSTQDGSIFSFVTAPIPPEYSSAYLSSNYLT